LSPTGSRLPIARYARRTPPQLTKWPPRASISAVLVVALVAMGRQASGQQCALAPCGGTDYEGNSCKPATGPDQAFNDAHTTTCVTSDLSIPYASAQSPHLVWSQSRPHRARPLVLGQRAAWRQGRDQRAV
jgi:hypothetical protein